MRLPNPYLDDAAQIGCIACLLDGNEGTPAELHHPRAKAGMGERSDDEEIIPLCPSHHRTGQGGVIAVHRNTEAFRAKYGEDWLLSSITRNLVMRLRRNTIGRARA